jgi:hypothetical protein
MGPTWGNHVDATFRRTALVLRGSVSSQQCKTASDRHDPDRLKEAPLRRHAPSCSKANGKALICALPTAPSPLLEPPEGEHGETDQQQLGQTEFTKHLAAPRRRFGFCSATPP